MREGQTKYGNAEKTIDVRISEEKKGIKDLNLMIQEKHVP